MTNGYLRVAAVTPMIKIGDVEANVSEIINIADKLRKSGVEVAVFPELCVTGYTCADLFHNSLLLEDASHGVESLREWSRGGDMDIIVGSPMIVEGGGVANCALFISNGEVDRVIKTYLPEYNEFYERRWFVPAPMNQKAIFESHGALIGIEVCEDLWAPQPPSVDLCLAGAEVMFNLSASDDTIGKYDYTVALIGQQSARTLCGYVYASSGTGESSTDLVFSPKAIIAENGKILQSNNRWDDNDNIVIADIDIEALRRERRHVTTFTECARRRGVELHEQPANSDTWNSAYRLVGRSISPMPFVPEDTGAVDERCEEIVNIQTVGLSTRLKSINCKSAVVGISGGLDSTLALLVTARAFDRLGLPRTGIVGVTMPGFGTTDRTYDNAITLMTELGVTVREVPIAAAVTQHFKDIRHDSDVHDVTYENSQARERTQIIMDIANQIGGIVVGTGDLSELALGWATYNGDHMSMYGVNSGVPKTLVRHLVGWFASRAATASLKSTLEDILATPVSPELLPPTSTGEICQRTEDLVGPYELHDFFIYYTLRYGFTPRRIYWLAVQAFEGKFSPDVILKWEKVFFRRFFSQQFKRSCMPDGPKVGSVCLSPRGDWRMPSDASSAAWLRIL